jgi:hypothetical protein
VRYLPRKSSLLPVERVGNIFARRESHSGALSWLRHNPFEADELLIRDDPNEKAAIVGQRA